MVDMLLILGVNMLLTPMLKVCGLLDCLNCLGSVVFLRQLKTGMRGCLSMDLAQKLRMLRILVLRNIMV